jgi:glycosyltransferase involved in cell wall biosynthesis
MSREKAPDIVIRALAEAPLADATLSMIGDGPEREHVVSLAASLGVADRVRWHGVRADASALLTAFDVLVLSSRTEGTPLILLEAMAAGVPIVATRVGGVPEVVPQEHALLVEPERPDRLAAAIAGALRDPEASARRADRARGRLAEHYGVEGWVARYDAVYDSILRSTARMSA